MMILLSALAMAATPAQRIEITPELIADLPRQQISIAGHDDSVQRCEGVPLTGVLAKAGLPAVSKLHGKDLRKVVVAHARDGYAVAFSLGELDEALGNARVVLVDKCNYEPLGQEDGPFRLALPGDQRGARMVRQLIALEILSID